MDNELQVKINQLRKLTQFKDYSDAQLADYARQKIKEQQLKEQYDFVLEGLPITSAEEKKIIRQILIDYLDGVYIENKKQLFQLKDLVYNEYKKRTTREQIEKQQKDKPDSVPGYAIDAYHKLIDKGQELQDRIFGTDLKDDISVLKQLFYRLKLSLAENQGTRTFPCLHCGKMLVAKIRMDKYDVSKHPWFKDKLLTNQFLMEKYIEGDKIVVDEKFIAKVLDCSELYTEWFLERHFSKNHPLYKKYLEKKDKFKRVD